MKTIVVGYDDTEPAKRALERAADLASAFGSRLVVTSVVPVLTPSVGRSIGTEPEDEGMHEAQLAAAKAFLAGRWIEADYIEALGHPAESIVEAAWRHGMSKTVLAPPSAQAKTVLSCNSPDPESGKSRRRGSDECLRLDQKGRAMDARYRLISRDSAYARRNTDDEGSGSWGRWREPGYAAYGDAGRSSGGSRDWWGGPRRDDQPAWQGQRRDDQPGWQSQRRGFWNW